MTTNRQRTRQLNLGEIAQVMGLGPAQRSAPTERSATPTDRDEPPPSVDARGLSPEAFAARLRSLGLDASIAAPAAGLPARPGTMEHAAAEEHRRDGLRRVERAARRESRDRERAVAARGREIEAGAIDGRTASPEEIASRLGALGLDGGGFASAVFVERGRDLDPPAYVSAARDIQAGAARDRVVASEVHRAMQVGERVDARKLSAGELHELLRIRGAGF